MEPGTARSIDAAPARPPAAVLTRALRAAPTLSRSARPRLRAGPGGVEVHAGPSRQPPTFDPLGRGRTITGGAGLRNVELAMAHLGHRARTTLLPDPADPLHLATIGPGSPVGAAGCGTSCGTAQPEPMDRRLYLAMARGHEQAGVFSARQLSVQLADRLREAGTPGAGVLVTAVTGNQLRTVGTVLAAAVADAVAVGTDADPGLADVARLLTRPSGGRAPAGRPGALLADRLERGRLLLIATPADTPADWVRAGWAAQNVLLTAVDRGLLTGVIGGVLDAPGVRATLADRLGLTGCPQLLLRVGWAKAATPGDRHPRVDRPVEADRLPLP